MGKKDFLDDLSTSSKRPHTDEVPESGDEGANSDADDVAGSSDELACFEKEPSISPMKQAISSLEDVFFP